MPLPSLSRAARGFARVLAIAVVLVLVAASVLLGSRRASAAAGPIAAVAAESQYANVLSQIGGKYVAVTSILNNPNTDPHTFEASPSVARAIATAQLIVQNGLGYDGFMDNIESASPSSRRLVIVAQHVLGLKDTTPNPHLWYAPTTMSKVAAVMAKDLAKLLPQRAGYFAQHLRAFDASLQPWLGAIAAFKAAHHGVAAAVTEPVADDLLKAMGIRVRTPFRFQADLMNGVDPAPQDMTFEQHLLSAHEVRVFCYNEQVVDALTASIRQVAKSAHVPVVAVYETMPAPGYDYQSWMMAEEVAIARAVTHAKSTVKL